MVAEEAVVRKAGGKFKMNPLFPSTVAKITAVRIHLLSAYLLSTKIRADQRQMLEKDQPVRDGTWTSAEIELINEKVPISFNLPP